MRTLPLLAASLWFSCAIAAPARAVCLPDTLSWVDDATNAYASHEASSGSDAYFGAVFSVPGEILRKSQEASYDLGVGQFHAKADLQVTYMAGYARANGRVRAQDTYTVLGPDGAGPATFTARLDYHVTCSGYYEYSGFNGMQSMPSGDASLALALAGASRDQAYHTGNGTTHDSLEVQVTRGPGGTFELSFDVHAIADGVADWTNDHGSNRTVVVDANLVIRDLPAQWSVVSCKGYQAGHIVPVRHSTWGRLKSGYR